MVWDSLEKQWDKASPGDKAELVGRGISEIAAAFIPASWFGEAGKAKKVEEIAETVVATATNKIDDVASTVEKTLDKTKKSDAIGDSGVKIKEKPYSDPKNRPKYGKGQVEKVWENAKGPDGKVRDPNTLEELTWDPTKSRAGQWDMGHMPDQEYRKLHKRYMDGEITTEEFLKEYREPKNYRPESSSANRSHKYESK